MSARGLLDRLAGRAVERAFGEVVLVVPRRMGPNSAGTADPERAIASLKGVFSIAPGEKNLFSDRKGGVNAIGQTHLVLPGTWLTVTADELIRAGYLPTQGDLVRCIARAGSPQYRISSIERDDLGAVLFHLSAEAAS
jgi:hypothetical protein